MTKKIYAAFVAVISALAFTTPASKAAHDANYGHTTASHVRRRATRVRKRVRQQAVRYVCPMHPDMRSQSKGECPKCRMQLLVERPRAHLTAARVAGK
jgi:hypothetical protein